MLHEVADDFQSGGPHKVQSSRIKGGCLDDVCACLEMSGTCLEMSGGVWNELQTAGEVSNI